MRTRPRRAVLALTTVLLAGGSLLAGCGSDSASPDSAAPTAAAPPEVPAEADAAASWLVGQTEDGVLHTTFEDPPGSGEWTTEPDYGLSLDVLFALQVSEEYAEQRSAVLDALEPQVDAYVGSGSTAYAGSLGKLVTALDSEGRDPGGYAEGDLVTRLESLVHTRDDQEQGRAKDAVDPADEFGGDYSNTIGQSWVVRALHGVHSDRTEEATAFLVRQQCADGFFRVPMESRDHRCDTGTEEESTPSVDATAFAVLALLEVQQAAGQAGQEPGDPAEPGDSTASTETAETAETGEAAVAATVDEALEGARTWLLAEQAQDGSFTDADSGTANANSTGVAGEALLALGEDEAAQDAARWLAGLQVATGESGDRPDDGEEPSGQVAGAVAFDPAALQAAQTRGITRATRYQWQRATAQAVEALTALDSAES